MRVVCYAQHLTGVGHFVRMHLIAQGLAGSHEVHLVDGGRPVPRAPAGIEPRRLTLPPLLRASDGRLTAIGGAPVETVLDERAELLANRVRAIRPHALLVDHFPFSKLELDREISAALDAARQVNSSVRVLCSLRDIAPKTRDERLGDDAYAGRVLQLLSERFDHLLVHADPAFTRLEDHFPRASEIPIPVSYTGFVAEAPAPPARAARPWAVLSAGGVGSTSFLAAAVAAFHRVPGAEGIWPHVFLDPNAGPEDEAEIREAAGGGPVEVHAFSPDFSGWLSGAVLSIGRAGYNTTTQLLRVGIRAVVVPDARLSDQVARAQRLERAGVAVMVRPEHENDVDALAAAIGTALGAPRPRHGFDLDGVDRTVRLVEALVDAEASTSVQPSPRARLSPGTDL